MSDRVDEAAFVREQYATPDRLRARKSAYADAEGDDPREFAFEAIAAAHPRRVLEVGGGEGELVERVLNELGAEVVGVDQSEGMVEIQRSKGIDAHVGDVQALPFGDEEFDVAIAAWMLYHVADLDLGLAELARVLRPGGRLVAVTNAVDHLQELWDLAERATSIRRFTFRTDNGEEALMSHFAHVERRDATGFVVMDDAAVRRFAESWDALAPLVRMPPLGEPLRVRRHSTVFTAHKAVG
ncbi:MAG TPA: class I SAM-dependent methyltransferase [Gaiellaceae bacterium]|nr:class I SAM-dependent methyltransferase [Gaiellaceae bacterium]